MSCLACGKCLDGRAGKMAGCSRTLYESPQEGNSQDGSIGRRASVPQESRLPLVLVPALIGAILGSTILYAPLANGIGAGLGGLLGLSIGLALRIVYRRR
jgi:hypothetical protein